jgi:hypothetical protein
MKTSDFINKRAKAPKIQEAKVVEAAVPKIDAASMLNNFESLIQEGAIKPDQLAQLSQLKRNMQQQASQPKSLSDVEKADLAAWEKDFAATHGSRTVAQDTPAAAPGPAATPDWRTQPRDTRKKISSQKAKADRLISMGEKMLALIDRSEKFPGGIPPGLRSDLENLEVAFDSQNPDYDKLIELYTKRLTQLQDFVNMKRAVYRKPKTPRYNESVAEGAPELLKAEMPLVRHIEQELEQHGYQKGTEEYTKVFGHMLAFHRKFGNAYRPNWQDIAEGRFELDRSTMQMKHTTTDPDQRHGLYINGKLVKTVNGQEAANELCRRDPRFQNAIVKKLAEDATGGASCSSTVATVVGELGEGGMTRRQVNKKLGGYSNVLSKGKKNIKVKGSY